MEKINVLWIEDNPIQESLQVRVLIARIKTLANHFTAADYKLGVPAIHFDDKDLKNYHQFFNLQVLQHPLEIKDFITMCLQLEDEKGMAAFKKMGVVLPDIIVFDYHFGAKITVNRGGGAIGYTPKFQAVREYINPNFKFRTHYEKLFGNRVFELEDDKTGGFSADDFLMKISKAKDKAEIKKKDRDELDNDDFGLLSAVEILRVFRNHTTVAIPATYNKRQIEQMSLHGKYFEWLNEYDFTIDFDRSERGTKKWDYILKDAAVAMQDRIVQQVRQGKLTPYLIQLSQLACGLAQDDPIHRKVTLQNAYGVHQYPLDGLFINVAAGEARNRAIALWAEKLFKQGLACDDSSAENNIIKEALKHADTLWSAYQSQSFCDRLQLSKLAKIKSSKTNNVISQELEEKYHDYLHTNKYFEILKEGSRKNNEVFIIKNCVELRKLIPKNTKASYTQTDLNILSWTALFVILQLYKGRADYLKKAKMSATVLPSRKELLTLLFPIASAPLILPIDNGDETKMNAFVAQLFFKLDDVVEGNANLFSEDRKFILRAYAASIGLTDEKHMPEWIKAL